MDPRHRKEILGQWGVRDPNPVESGEARQLARELEGSPLHGKPLPSRVGLRPSADSYVTSLGGPLPYMLRRQRIENETAVHTRRLDAAQRELAAGSPDPAAFARRWRDLAGRWVFDDVNELIEAHNRWFPAESRLAMDPRTGDFVLVGGERYELRPLDAAWILERFPAGLEEEEAA